MLRPLILRTLTLLLAGCLSCLHWEMGGDLSLCPKREAEKDLLSSRFIWLLLTQLLWKKALEAETEKQTFFSDPSLYTPLATALVS